MQLPTKKYNNKAVTMQPFEKLLHNRNKSPRTTYIMKVVPGDNCV